ncbi:hypothetical protein PoMZ_02769 [Pyricularia oryzae]|uniref:Uncharacterized protein n=1 Tax=Pyricularia oryzae TaxID=318829 RepID=A0A4P7NBX9_PYROR|nr:hypothetical protein PoMZ_02769 [Pyricularia oryzae]
MAPATGGPIMIDALFMTPADVVTPIQPMITTPVQNIMGIIRFSGPKRSPKRTGRMRPTNDTPANMSRRFSESGYESGEIDERPLDPSLEPCPHDEIDGNGRRQLDKCHGYTSPPVTFPRPIIPNAMALRLVKYVDVTDMMGQAL